jgi:hypothetical protein
MTVMAITDQVQAPASSAGNGGTGDGGAKMTTKKKSAFGSVKGAVFLFIGVVVVSQALIAAAGWTTRVSVVLGVLSAGATAAGAFLLANRSQLSHVSILGFIAAFFAIAGIMVVAYLLKEDLLTHRGTFDKDNRVDEYEFSADAGEYALVLDHSDELKAGLKLSYGIFDLPGTTLEDGRVMIRDILIDGTWSAEIRALENTNGDYKLKVISDDADDIGVEDTRDEEILADPTYSNSYVLELPKRQKVYLRVAPSAGDSASLALRVMKPNGFEVAIPRREGNNLVVFRTLPAGTYIVAVRSKSYEAGEYGLVVSRKAPSGVLAEPAVATGSLVPVPDVVQFPRQAALDTLIAAGFAPRAFEVCSGSVGAGEVRQVQAVENGQQETVVDLPGVTDAGQQLEAGTSLIVKVGTGEPCP